MPNSCLTHGSADEDAGAIAARVVSAAKATDAATSPSTKGEDTPDTGTGPLTFDDEFLMSDEPEDILAVDPSVQRVKTRMAPSKAWPKSSAAFARWCLAQRRTQDVEAKPEEPEAARRCG